MNHEHVSLQMHLETFVPGIMRAVSNGLDKWLSRTKTRSIREASIVVTDSVDFAERSAETNTIVVLLVSSRVEIVQNKIQVANPDIEGITHAVYLGCVGAFA